MRSGCARRRLLRAAALHPDPPAHLPLACAPLPTCPARQVGFPATPLLTARMRVCISASHTHADLDYALEVFRDLVQRCV